MFSDVIDNKKLTAAELPSCRAAQLALPPPSAPPGIWPWVMICHVCSRLRIYMRLLYVVALNDNAEKRREMKFLVTNKKKRKTK